MKSISKNLRWAVVLLAMLGCTAGQPLTFQDMNGKAHTPLAAKQPVVFIFITSDCPISNGYAPEMNRLAETCTAKGIGFYLVQVDPDLTPAPAQQHAKEFGFRCPVLLDPKHRLVKLTQATVTPEAAVLTADGKLFYRGRINDLYAGLGQRRPEPTQHDLRDALDALLAGKSFAAPITTAVGCYIPK